MNNFDKLKNMDIESFAKWLDEHGQFDGSPWMDFFNENYCKKCESIKVKSGISEKKLGLSPLKYGGTVECAWCELHGKCKHFKKLKEVPSNIDIIKMWLSLEVVE